MGMKIEGNAVESEKNIHLIVIMRVRISQKIGLLDSTNRTRSKKVNGYKQRAKIVYRITG